MIKAADRLIADARRVMAAPLAGKPAHNEWSQALIGLEDCLNQIGRAMVKRYTYRMTCASAMMTAHGMLASLAMDSETSSIEREQRQGASEATKEHGEVWADLSKSFTSAAEAHHRLASAIIASSLLGPWPQRLGRA